MKIRITFTIEVSDEARRGLVLEDDDVHVPTIASGDLARQDAMAVDLTEEAREAVLDRLQAMERCYFATAKERLAEEEERLTSRLAEIQAQRDRANSAA